MQSHNVHFLFALLCDEWLVFYFGRFVISKQDTYSDTEVRVHHSSAPAQECDRKSGRYASLIFTYGYAVYHKPYACSQRGVVTLGGNNSLMCNRCFFYHHTITSAQDITSFYLFVPYLCVCTIY